MSDMSLGKVTTKKMMKSYLINLMIENYDCMFLLSILCWSLDTPHLIYGTSIPDNVATFNTLIRLILEIHFEDISKKIYSRS